MHNKYGTLKEVLHSLIIENVEKFGKIPEKLLCNITRNLIEINHLFFKTFTAFTVIFNG